MARVAPAGNDGFHFGLLLLLTFMSRTLNVAARSWCRGPDSHVEARARNRKVTEVIVARAASGRGCNRRHGRGLGREAGIAHSRTLLGRVLAHAVAHIRLRGLAGCGSHDWRLRVCCGGDEVEAAHRCRRRSRISSGGLNSAEYSGSVGDL